MENIERGAEQGVDQDWSSLQQQGNMGGQEQGNTGGGFGGVKDQMADGMANQGKPLPSCHPRSYISFLLSFAILSFRTGMARSYRKIRITLVYYTNRDLYCIEVDKLAGDVGVPSGMDGALNSAVDQEVNKNI